MAKQCIFVEDWKNVQCGILLNDGSMLCGCCGGTIEAEEFRLLKVYDYWAKLDEGNIIDPADLIECREKIEAMSDDEFYKWFDNC